MSPAENGSNRRGGQFIVYAGAASAMVSSAWAPCVQRDCQLGRGRRMADGVVQQVAAQLAQHPGVGLDGRGVGALIPVQVAPARSAATDPSHLAQHLVEARHGRLSLLAQLIHLARASIWLASCVARSTVSPISCSACVGGRSPRRADCTWS